MLVILAAALAALCASDHDFARLERVESRVAQLEQRLAAIEHQFDRDLSPRPVAARIEPTITIEESTAAPIWVAAPQVQASVSCSNGTCRVVRRWRRR